MGFTADGMIPLSRRLRGDDGPAPGAATTVTVHHWYPDLFETKGGIRTYSKAFLQAFAAACGGVRNQVFLLHDRGSSVDLSVPLGGSVRCSGGWPPRLRSSVFAARVLGHVARERPGLVIAGHVHFAVLAYWVRRVLGVPYWVIVHGLEAWNLEHPGRIKALRAADLVISASEYTRGRLIEEQSLAPEQVVLLPNTVDTDSFRPAAKPSYLLERHGLRADQPVILTVARLAGMERRKGYDSVLDVLPTISRRLPEVHYVLVGAGRDRDRVVAKIHALGLERQVTLAGLVSDAELRDYYNLCDVFAMPSKLEGFGIVFLEALASGKPVLGGNRDGAVDALCGGELGVLVDPDDPAELTCALTTILEGSHPHPLLYRPEELRRLTSERFGWPTFGQRLAGILNDHAPAW